MHSAFLARVRTRTWERCGGENGRKWTKVTLLDVSARYASTPLAKKLGVKENHRLALLHAPTEWAVHDLAPGVVVVRRRSSVRANVVLAFFSDLATLQREVDSLARCIVADGALWVVWPRRAGGHRSDITDSHVRDALLPLGLVDVKVAALDDNWSGLKMVWRKELRAGHFEAP